MRRVFGWFWQIWQHCASLQFIVQAHNKLKYSRKATLETGLEKIWVLRISSKIPYFQSSNKNYFGSRKKNWVAISDLQSIWIFMHVIFRNLTNKVQRYFLFFNIIIHDNFFINLQRNCSPFHFLSWLIVIVNYLISNFVSHGLSRI